MVERPPWSVESASDGAVPPKYRGVPEVVPEEGVIYRHYKGDLYRVIASGEHSEARHIWLTAYYSIKKKKVIMRPTKMFMEVLTWPDGIRRQRFTPNAAFKDQA